MNSYYWLRPIPGQGVASVSWYFVISHLKLMSTQKVHVTHGSPLKTLPS